MERIQSINPERIRWCCHDHGISVDEFRSSIGIAQSSFDKMMKNEGGVTFKQLRTIANFFNRGVLFFLEPGSVSAERVYTPQFRTIANQKPELSSKVKALIERVERHRDIYLNLRDELGEAEERKFEPPEMPRRRPKRAAAIVRGWLNLSDVNDFNSYRDAIESKGILVFRSNGYNGAWQIPKKDPVFGFSLYHPVSPVIVVKKLATPTRQSFTLMHELGHIVLHRSSFIDDEEDLYNHEGREQQANAFAGHLLIPEGFLGQIGDIDRPDAVAEYPHWLADQRNAWGVGVEVILRRLLDAGRITQAKYRAYRHWRENQPKRREDSGSRKWRHREPNHIFGEPFVRTVFDALSANHITLNKASSYLDNLKIKDLHQLKELHEGV